MKLLIEEVKAAGIRFPIGLEMDGARTHLDEKFLKLCVDNQVYENLTTKLKK